MHIKKEGFVGMGGLVAFAILVFLLTTICTVALDKTVSKCHDVTKDYICSYGHEHEVDPLCEETERDRTRKSLSQLDELKESFSNYKRLSKICTELITSAIGQIEELSQLIQDMEDYESAILETLLPEVLNAYEAVRIRVFQNLRDINTILITSRIRIKRSFSQNEKERFVKELEDNRRILDKFYSILSEVGVSSCQTDDAFSDLDIDSTYIAIQRYKNLKQKEKNDSFAVIKETIGDIDKENLRNFS